MQRRTTLHAGAVVGMLWASSAMPSIAQSLIVALEPPAGTRTFWPSAISRDLATIVGVSYPSSGNSHATRWTEAGGAVLLPRPSVAIYSTASGVSGDGSLVIGSTDYGIRQSAIRWDAQGNFHILDPLPTVDLADSEGTGMSDDGLVAVGWVGHANIWPYRDRGARWNLSGTIGLLPNLVSGSYTVVSGVSRDGSTIFGYEYGGPRRALVWRNNTVAAIGDLPGQTSTAPYAASSSGAYVVGYSSDFSNQVGRAFLWSQDAGMRSLGVLPGRAMSLARGVSDDGRLVIGTSGTGIDGTPIVWTPFTGMIPATDYLRQAGADLTGWQVTSVSCVTPDGRIILGAGVFNNQPRGFVARDLPRLAPCRADLDDDGQFPEGNADFGVDVSDLLFFLRAFEVADPRADMDDGTAAGTPDGAVTIDDLLFFLRHFELGC